jgi:serine/threonine protein kinase
MSDPSASGDLQTRVRASAPDWPAIPGFEIIEELGRGGMGVVYKARQPSFQRLVALKLIRDGALAGPDERARFRIEMEAARRMRHPNVIEVYEAGDHQGQPYYAMEFVKGLPLDRHLAGRPQTALKAAELLRTLATAVQYAHGQKVVHRDLKPANILLAAESTAQENDSSSSASLATDYYRPSNIPKITDFGLAKRLDSESTALTVEGAVLGTASYMAPEQAAGRVHEIGPAVDIYALGAIFYELLTGRPPFRAESWKETIDQVLYDEPIPPTRLQSDVPRDLETVCLKCLEKDPSRRYASAAELADDLGRILEGRPVVAVPLSAKERLARFALRDGYQIADEIGRGPRSTVYRALSGPLQQPVALKVFAAEICTREEWEIRIRRCTELWAALAHPNLIPIQRTGWWDGTPYLVMEYVPHRSLADELPGQPYPITQALRLVEQLAEIVTYLHRQGVVHGNLKPSNVLLAAGGIPRVGDLLGTGGLFHGPLPSGEDATPGVGYLAPELIREPRGEPLPTTDIYGLGMILYELLAGRPVFDGATARETLEQVRSQEPLRPSHFNSKVTPYLELFCLRCLSKNPYRRYSRAYVVLKRLRYFQDNPEEHAEFERRPK